ncbi:MAG: hypothetical protein KY054_00630 [Candidatus Nealsonbacteria bacterium]|nr:hypothetical protein [Candidatus Nealsonbacteria bacterium]
MALEDIIKKIEVEAEEKVKEIEAETKKAISHIEEKGVRELDRKKKEILAEAEKQKKSIIEKARFDFKGETKDKITERKLKVIDDVYLKVFGELSNLKKEDYLKLLDKFWSKISDKSGLEIFIADKRENETNEFFQGKGVQIAGTVNSQGGFIAKTSKLEVDNTFESIINNFKKEVDMEVVKILFNS